MDRGDGCETVNIIKTKAFIHVKQVNCMAGKLSQ